MTLDQTLAYGSTGLEETEEGPRRHSRGRLAFFLALAAVVGVISMKRRRSHSVTDERD